MIRTTLIIFFLFIFVITFSQCVFAEQKSEDKQPNILVIFADDWGLYSDTYADKVDNAPWNNFAPTPNLSKLANKGVVFTNAFVSSPQCTPARSSFLSGQAFYKTGLAAVQDGIWDYTRPSFPMLLRDEGYHAGYSSKVWSPGTPKDAPFGGTEFEYENSGTDYDEFSQFVYKKMSEGMSADDAKHILYEQVRGNFKTFLSQRKEKQPFLYWFGGRNPHREWIKGSGKTLWNINPDDLKGSMPPFLPDVHEVREDFADYFGEIRAFDEMIKVLLEILDETGESDNTIIMVSGDHGAPGFTHGKANLYDFGTKVPLVITWPNKIKPGRVVTDFVGLMDLAPTFLQAANADVPDTMEAKSLMPILQSDAQGRVDPSRNWIVTGRERHVSTAREGNLPYPQRAYRTDDYLYIINFKPNRWPGGSPYNITETHAPNQHKLEHDTFITHNDMDGGPTKAFIVLNRHAQEYAKYYDIAFAKRPMFELYDLHADPYNIHNLAGKHEYKDIQSHLHKSLMLHLKNGGDPRVIGDGSRFDRMPYTFERWRSN